MHCYLITTHILKTLFDTDDNDYIFDIVKSTEIFVYMGTILYLQYYVHENRPNNDDTSYVYYSKVWMMLELFVFYSTMFNGAIFLFYI